MPRSLPPVAPRFPSAPTAPPAAIQIHNPPLPAPDAPDPMERVRTLARQPGRYISEPNPFTMALWFTLNEPAAVVLTRHADAMRCAIEASQLPVQHDDPTERGIVASGLPRTVSAIQAVTDALVARAIQGDISAGDVIAKRIEGTVGQRRGDIDPHAEAQRATVRRTIEQLVRDMAERAATVIDVDTTN